VSPSRGQAQVQQVLRARKVLRGLRVSLESSVHKGNQDREVTLDPKASQALKGSEALKGRLDLKGLKVS
jgi:hypothetical protein